MLEQYMGHAVEEASDASEAAALLIAAAKGGSSSEAAQFDAVFIDCALPAVNGPKVAKILRLTGKIRFIGPCQLPLIYLAG